MDEQFQCQQLRLDRADEHLAAIDREAGPTLYEKERRIVAHFEPETHSYVYRVQDALPDISLGLHVGEFAHQLRAALDNTVYRLVELHGNVPHDRTSFVIADTEEIWRAFRSNLRGLSDEEMEFIRGEQPYHRGDEATNHPLSRLGWLNNRDKHRFFHASYFLHPETDVPLYRVHKQGEPGEWFTRRMRQPDSLPGFQLDPLPIGIEFSGFDNRADVLRYAFDSSVTDPQVIEEHNLPVEVSLTDPERPLTLDDLREIRTAVGSIVGRLVAPFA